MVKSFVLSKKKGKEAHIVPSLSGDHFTYTVQNGKSEDVGTVIRSGGHCLACNATIPFDYIRNEGMQKRLGADLMAVVAEGKNGRLYVSPDELQKKAANVDKPADYPSGVLSGKARVNVSLYGFDETSDLFTNRQLTALTTFSALVGEAQKKAEADAIAASLVDDNIGLADGGFGARAYGEAIAIYLAFTIDKMADRGSTICGWDTQRDGVTNTFGRQAIPMKWDFAEANPFSNSSGCFDNVMMWITKCILEFPASSKADVRQFDAQQDCGLRNIMVSTDPPYYDNIDYADLSDYFFVWMRNSLQKFYPELFATLLSPKSPELVATPYRHDGDMSKAKSFFESGMFKACQLICQYAADNIPTTIYFAFKQNDTDKDNKTASSGWETMLSSLINANFAIVGTWPMRTELTTALKSSMNALASSIVLVCRKRAEDARSVTRREFINALHREIRPALKKLQSANLAPVDLAQSAIGPGIGVFSRYRSVLEADGKPMSVRAALQIINQELDAFYNEQEGELDRESRFCVELFNQSAFNTIKFGDADILARAKNTSVQALADRGVLQAAKGQVRLLTREEIPEKVRSTEECVWLLTQQLARAMEVGGVKECAQIVMNLFGSNAENAKALAYRLYTICERKNWAAEGYAYNNLVVAWPDIQSMAANLAAATPVQVSMEDVFSSTEQ